MCRDQGGLAAMRPRRAASLRAPGAGDKAAQGRRALKAGQSQGRAALRALRVPALPWLCPAFVSCRPICPAPPYPQPPFRACWLAARLFWPHRHLFARPDRGTRHAPEHRHTRRFASHPRFLLLATHPVGYCGGSWRWATPAAATAARRFASRRGFCCWLRTV